MGGRLESGVLGRAEQLGALAAALDRADGGEAAAVFIDGEAGDDAAERDAVTRAHALLNQLQTLNAAEKRPLGGAPKDMDLEVELCELEASRASGETNADGWAAHSLRWQQLGRPYRAAYTRLREAEAALAESLPRARVAESLASARDVATRLGARPLLHEIDTAARRARVRAAREEREATPDELAGLTSRELEVLRLIAAGHTIAKSARRCT